MSTPSPSKKKSEVIPYQPVKKLRDMIANKITQFGLIATDEKMLNDILYNFRRVIPDEATLYQLMTKYDLERPIKLSDGVFNPDTKAGKNNIAKVISNLDRSELLHLINTPQHLFKQKRAEKIPVEGEEPMPTIYTSGASSSLQKAEKLPIESKEPEVMDKGKKPMIEKEISAIPVFDKLHIDEIKEIDKKLEGLISFLRQPGIQDARLQADIAVLKNKRNELVNKITDKTLLEGIKAPEMNRDEELAVLKARMAQLEQEAAFTAAPSAAAQAADQIETENANVVVPVENTEGRDEVQADTLGTLVDPNTPNLPQAPIPPPNQPPQVPGFQAQFVGQNTGAQFLSQRQPPINTFGQPGTANVKPYSGIGMNKSLVQQIADNTQDLVNIDLNTPAGKQYLAQKMKEQNDIIVGILQSQQAQLPANNAKLQSSHEAAYRERTAYDTTQTMSESQRKYLEYLNNARKTQGLLPH